MPRWPGRLTRGFGYLTLNPSPRLRRLREEPERTSPGYGLPPPLPDSVYPPGAVPLDCSGIPDGDPLEHGRRMPDGRIRVHVPWSGWISSDGSRPFLRRR